MNSLNVTLGEVAEFINAEFSGNKDLVVNDVTHDSRQAREGVLFAAIRGLTTDGHRFVEDVMRRNSAGIISEFDKPENFAGRVAQSR